MSDKKFYTAGIKSFEFSEEIPEELRKFIEENNCHVSIAFLGALNNLKKTRVDAALINLANSLPFEFKVVGIDMFGPKRDVPVIVLEPTNRAPLDEFAGKYKQLRKWENGNKLQTFHLSIWEVDKRDQLYGLIQDQTFKANRIFRKELGPVDPEFSVSTHSKCQE